MDLFHRKALLATALLVAAGVIVLQFAVLRYNSPHRTEYLVQGDPSLGIASVRLVLGNEWTPDDEVLGKSRSLITLKGGSFKSKDGSTLAIFAATRIDKNTKDDVMRDFKLYSLSKENFSWSDTSADAQRLLTGLPIGGVPTNPAYHVSGWAFFKNGAVSLIAELKYVPNPEELNEYVNLLKAISMESN